MNVHKSDVRVKFDLYPTPALAIRVLLSREEFAGNIWECACGRGHISKALKRYGHKDITSTDINNKEWGFGKHHDFLGDKTPKFPVNNIITNPPYSSSTLFIQKALDVAKGKVAVFLSVAQITGVSRCLLFKKFPPKSIYVFVRPFDIEIRPDEIARSAFCHMWVVWDRRKKNKNTNIDWVVLEYDEIRKGYEL